VEELWKKGDPKDRLATKAVHSVMKDFYSAHKLKYKKEGVDALLENVDPSKEGHLSLAQFSELLVSGNSPSCLCSHHSLP
jgi:hypothetical protein